MDPIRIGILGGSGLYRMEGLTEVREHAMEALGVRYLLSVSAVGSMREEVAPLDMVLPDPFIDFTRRCEGSLCGDGAVAHVSLADPVCSVLAEAFADAAFADIGLHDGGTYECFEGPAFSTRAESNCYRSLGASVIGARPPAAADLPFPVSAEGLVRESVRTRPDHPSKGHEDRIPTRSSECSTCRGPCRTLASTDSRRTP
ncbi:MAG: hypothetical protein KDG44_19385 [Burkholderiaceae bacterium]|nr:hypothetical protein [Burkholderiaceae bacterium]